MLFGANDDDFSKVRDGGDDSCSEFDFSVSFINSEDVVTSRVFFIDKLFHVVIDLVGTEVDLKLL